LRIEPKDSAVHIQTDGGGSEVVADRVVVSAGIWSRSLAAQLGDRIPLDTERGYNATYPKGTFGIGRPIMFEGEGFVTSPLDTGDRVGGAVEFAGLEAPPNHGRTDAMVQRLTRFLPHLKSKTPAQRWMGFRPSIPDSLPVIGPAGKDRRVIYAFGHGHFGLTQAAITSRLVTDLIEHKPIGMNLKPFMAQRF
jgi:D-amino-acid dehydrogenase